MVPRQTKLDLSSPAATLISLGSAVNRGDFAQAAQCVVGLRPQKDVAKHPVVLVVKGMQITIALGKPQVTVRGTQAVINVATQVKTNIKTEKKEVHKTERVLLSLVRGQWKVQANPLVFFPFDGYITPKWRELNKDVKDSGVLTFVATVVADPDRALVFWETRSTHCVLII